MEKVQLRQNGCVIGPLTYTFDPPSPEREYPILPALPDTFQKAPGVILALQTTLPTIGDNVNRPWICSFYFSPKGDVITTDSYQASFYRLPNPEKHPLVDQSGTGILLPKLIAEVLKDEKLDDILEATYDENRVYFRAREKDGLTMHVIAERLKGYTYPNLYRLVPDDTKGRFRVSPKQLEEVLKLVPPINSDNEIEFIVTPGSSTATIVTYDKMRSTRASLELPLASVVEDRAGCKKLKISFNRMHWLDFCKVNPASQEEDVLVRFNDEYQAVWVHAGQLTLGILPLIAMM